MSYKVTAPLVIVANDDHVSGDGYFYENAVIPDGYNDERCKELVELGMLEKVSKQEASSAATDAAGGDSTPTRSASKADWVAFSTDEARGDKRLSEEQANEATRDELAERFLGPKE